jgi:hypothetical protein
MRQKSWGMMQTVLNFFSSNAGAQVSGPNLAVRGPHAESGAFFGDVVVGADDPSPAEGGEWMVDPAGDIATGAASWGLLPQKATIDNFTPRPALDPSDWTGAQAPGDAAVVPEVAQGLIFGIQGNDDAAPPPAHLSGPPAPPQPATGSPAPHLGGAVPTGDPAGSIDAAPRPVTDLSAVDPRASRKIALPAGLSASALTGLAAGSSTAPVLPDAVEVESTLAPSLVMAVEMGPIPAPAMEVAAVPSLTGKQVKDHRPTQFGNGPDFGPTPASHDLEKAKVIDVPLAPTWPKDSPAEAVEIFFHAPSDREATDAPMKVPSRRISLWEAVFPVASLVDKSISDPTEMPGIAPTVGIVADAGPPPENDFILKTFFPPSATDLAPVSAPEPGKATDIRALASGLFGPDPDVSRPRRPVESYSLPDLLTQALTDLPLHRLPDGLAPSPQSSLQIGPLGFQLAALHTASAVPHLAAQLVAGLATPKPGVTEISLSPAELGRVKLRLQADAQNPDRMVVMLSFDRPETLDLFRRHADQLTEVIRSAGYTGVDIGFAQQGQGDQPWTREGATGSADPTSLPDLETPMIPNSLHRPHSAGAGLDLRL